MDELRKWMVSFAVSVLVAAAGGSPAIAKTVALVDNSFNDNFLNCGEGWVRAQAIADIQIGGSFTTGLGMLADDDALIIVAHSSGAGNFVWGSTEYTAFGAGAGEMAVPAGFANRKNIRVHFVTCFSATAPSGGSSILSKLLAAMGGAGNGNTGTGFVGTANTHVVWNMSNGNAAQYTAAEACVNANNSPWIKNPPANRPNTGGNAQPANQKSAAQALVENCNGVPANTLTFNIPNRVGVVGTTTGYAPPSDGGAAVSPPPSFLNGVAVCGQGDDSHAADDAPTPATTTTWGRVKTTYR